jgi:seryl-tRNA synthetase
MTKNVRTVEEDLAALQEKREKVLQDVVKARLTNNPRFQGMVDAFKKSGRYLKEAENLLDEEKYTTQRAAIQARLDTLDEKRAVAQAAHSDLTELRNQHQAAQEELAQALIAFLDGGEIPEDFDTHIEAMLNDVDADVLSREPADPFTAYRRQPKSED